MCTGAIVNVDVKTLSSFLSFSLCAQRREFSGEGMAAAVEAKTVEVELSGKAQTNQAEHARRDLHVPSFWIELVGEEAIQNLGIWNAVDDDGERIVDFDDIDAEEMDSRYDLTERRLRQFFDRFDSNSDSLISSKEFRRGLAKFGFQMLGNDIDTLISVIETRHSTEDGQFSNRGEEEITPELFAIALRQLRLAELCIIDKISREQEAKAEESLRRQQLYDPLYRKLFICDYSTNVVRLHLTHDGEAEDRVHVNMENDERIAAFTGFPVPRERVFLNDFLFSPLTSESSLGISPLTVSKTHDSTEKSIEGRSLSSSATRRWIHLPHFGKSILLRLAARYSLHPLALQTVLEMRREASKMERYGRQYCISINVLQLDVSVSKESEKVEEGKESERDRVTSARHRGGEIQSALERAMGAEDEIPPEVRVHCSFATIILGPGEEADWMIDGGRIPGQDARGTANRQSKPKAFTWAITFETHQKTVKELAQYKKKQNIGRKKKQASVRARSRKDQAHKLLSQSSAFNTPLHRDTKGLNMFAELEEDLMRDSSKLRDYNMDFFACEASFCCVQVVSE